MFDFNIDTAAQLAAQLDGARSGREWRCRCPVHGGHRLSITEGHSGNGAARLVDVSRSVNNVIVPQLGVAEGIEATLSCMQLFDIPAWAAYHRWAAEARTVQMPPLPGTDVNDVLVDRGGRDG